MNFIALVKNASWKNNLGNFLKNIGQKNAFSCLLAAGGFYRIIYNSSAILSCGARRNAKTRPPQPEAEISFRWPWPNALELSFNSLST